MEKTVTHHIDRTTMTARKAVGAVFFVNGATFGSWAVHIPTIKEALRLSEGQLGGAQLALAAGAVITMPVAGRIIDRINSRVVTQAASLLFTLCLVFPLLAAWRYTKNGSNNYRVRLSG